VSIAAKIPTFVLIYHDPPTIRASLDWLTSFRDRLDLIVLENPSESTEGEIRPYIEGLLARGHVTDYYLFDENISNNAFEVALRADQDRWRAAPYVMITDGDLVGPEAGWLEEEIDVLVRHEDAYACGLSLHMDNLPVAEFPEAVHWVPSPRAIHDDHHEGLTGVHLLLMRSEGLAGFLDHQRSKALPFRDSVMHKYAYEELGQRWTRTKDSLARHLTWDLYAQPDHPYREMKTSKSLDEHWRHDRYCGFTAVGKGHRSMPA
jgi:hypothetical protein